MPNAESALTLGEIAEEGKHSDEAIRQYATAFMLASQEAIQISLARRWIAKCSACAWAISGATLTQFSTTGLGDIVLSAYER